MAFSITEDPPGVEVEEGSGNAFHLGPILRKYTPAKLVVRGARRTTTVEFPALYDALGLLRGLQYDVARFNAAAEGCTQAGGAADAARETTASDAAHAGPRLLSGSQVRYACFRLTRQASAFGVRVPRPGYGTVCVPGLDELVTLVEAQYADTLVGARALLAGGVIDFTSLAELFVPGSDLVDRGAVTGLFGVPTSMRARACYFSRGKALFGVTTTFYAAVEFVVAVGDRFAVVEATVPIGEFQGTRSTREGLDTFTQLAPPLRAELTERGALYSRLALEGAFMEYAPGAFLPVARTGVGAARSPTRSRGSGRIMIDSGAAWARGVHCARSEGVASEAVKGVLKLVAQRLRMVPGGGSGADGFGASSSGQAAASAEEESLDLLLLPSPLPPSLTWLSWPVVAGFSFHAKSWGVALVAGLRPVLFNEAAFDRLVLPDARKRLMRALVESHASVGVGGGFGASLRAGGVAAGGGNPTGGRKQLAVDVIAGKGEGTIFLLHGPPGVGKTLTAEAIAELLHRPLYVVSMGELGTTPEALEERLTDILDLCTPWGALVLIDEAEMLLEARSRHDLVRNAMVCVMLRLLEYFTGILFLTTNRVGSLDPAFQSRVQCALRYEALDAVSRQRIWEGMLAGLREGSVDSSGIDTAALAVHPLNGRQIKNTLQLGMALCASEGVPLAQRHVGAALELTTAFVEETGGGGGGGGGGGV